MKIIYNILIILELTTSLNFTGEWLYGKRNGTGINVWGNGEKYIGE